MTDVQSGEANIWNPRNLVAVSSDTKRIEESQVATEGQTLFTLTSFSYVPNAGSLAVYVNGVFQKILTDWNEQSDTTFFLVAPATVGDFVTAVGFTAIQSTGGSGDFLPLAGGTMNIGAPINWGHGTVLGKQSYSSILGKPTFQWSALNIGGNEVGYRFTAATDKTLGYNDDGRFSLELTGRNISFANLVADDVMTKADTTNMAIRTLDWDHLTDFAGAGFIASSYITTTLAALTGEALVFTNAKIDIYQGYKFITGATDGTKYDIDLAGGQIWCERDQNDTTGIPLGKQLVTRDWVENFGPGGVEEAPQDSQDYVRNNAAWVLDTGGTGVEEAPIDGTEYVRIDAGWASLPAAGAVAWGDLTGTLSLQTDLQAELDLKAPLAAANTWAAAQTMNAGATVAGLGLVVSGNTLGVGAQVTANFVVGGECTFNDTISLQGSLIRDVANGLLSTDAVNLNQLATKAEQSTTYTKVETDSQIADAIPAGWQIDFAGGSWLSTGADNGTQRNCTVSRASLGSYLITLSTALSSVANGTVNIDAFGAFSGVDIVYAITSTTSITVNTVISATTNNGDSVDVGCSFSIKDRGLT